MKKFWGYTANDTFSVGCTGQTIYLYDKEGHEIKQFRDLIYAYTPMISPDGKLLVVKSSDGRLAVFSLETLSLLWKFRFSKVDGAQDDGFCFSPDGKFFLNIERQQDSLHSAISIYDTTDFSRVGQVLFGDDKMINHVEYYKPTNKYYVLGFMRDEDKTFTNGFVAEFDDCQIKNVTVISKQDHKFYQSYKSLEMMGFTEKAYKWAYTDANLEELKFVRHSLGELYLHYNQTVMI